MTIMIVDDNLRMRSAIRSVAAGKSDHVIECGNGAEAVSAYEQFHPDWVLMDINMPVMDGIAATRRILSNDPAARIVMVTDNVIDSFQTASAEAGAMGFVSKEDLFAITEFIKH